ncbi:hypothetical protein BGZ76_006612 [Entomortierella beljakovae]|nr:hypothetical protein BGZ76_006612 [Entomortierella beljakovae]
MSTACVALIVRVAQLASETDPSPSTLLATVSLLVAWLLGIWLNYFENQIEDRSSTCIFSFYLICIISSMINVRTMHGISFSEQSQFISFCVFFASIICGFVVEAWPRSPRVSLSTGESTEKPTTYDQANMFSRLWFAFMDPTIFQGYRQHLQDEDIENMMPKKIRTENSYPTLNRAWDNHVYKRKLLKKEPSLMWILFKTSGWAWAPIVFFTIFEACTSYIQPILLDNILGFIESYSTDSPQPTALGIILAIGMFFAAVLSSVSSGQFFQKAWNLAIELKTGLTSMIYRKSLVLSPDARRKATVGEITNHMSVDAERIGQAISMIPLIIATPFEIGIAVWLLYRQLGPSALTGLGAVIIMMPVQGFIAKILNNAKNKKLSAMDSRIRLVSDVLSGIKAVKLYSWEKSFQEKLEGYRNVELKYLKQISLTTAVMMIMYSSLPSLMALLSFVVYSTVGGPNGTPGVMSARVIFVSITLFNRLSLPIGRASQVIGQAISLNVAVKRIQSFLVLDEINQNQVQHDSLLLNASASGSNHSLNGGRESSSSNQEAAHVRIHKASFSWSTTDSASIESDKPGNISPKPKSATLSNINLSVPCGSLTVVMGRVGQGKSSLLNAIIGDMYMINDGTIQVNGTVAYVPQEAWIMNCSVQDNILFGKTLDQDRYQQILEACSLLHDLEMLPAGDQTEIGERGINLSGGQKQRVSLARAAYQDADIYLLDDPLSAVDAHVDQHLWSNLIGPQGILKNKTRVLVTHGIHHLGEVDRIVLIKDGVIEEQGDYMSLMSAKRLFYQLIDEYSVAKSVDKVGSKGKNHGADAEGSQDDGITTEVVEEIPMKDAGAEDEDNAELIMKEEAALGSIGWNVFKVYCKATTYFLAVIGLLGFIFSQASQIGINVWLQTWASKEGDEDQPSVGFFLGIYSVFVCLYIFFDMGANTVVLMIGGVRATKILHQNLLNNVMKLPMSFFDTTPTGRITNRFSSDVDNVDELLPISISDLYFFASSVLGTLIVISTSLPIFLAIVPLLIAIYFALQTLYMKSSRQLKRIHSISKSPMYQHFGETLSGVSTIRAMGLQDRFIRENSTKSDKSANAYFVYNVVVRWLHIRLEFLGALVILATALLTVLGRESLGSDRAGLVLSYAINTTFAITYLVKSYSEFLNELVSVERIQEYTLKKQEAPSRLPEDDKLPPNWPSEGRIVFKDYSTRYRQGLELVIKDISFEIQPAEKVGVVGRTGAGKSSLTLALFRIIEAANSHWAIASYNGSSESQMADMEEVSTKYLEPDLSNVLVDEDGGSIEIDGVDISTLGLETLRQHLAIIPQDPIIFSGTVRENLDPFNQASDTEIWEALERAHLKEHIASLGDGLLFEVAQNGENFSIGQRSLICLARALLRKTKILVLDEATSAVDVETDELIQKTIRKEFKDRTILTIAHRIKTIMDSDKILVLEKGQVQEFDTPTSLLNGRGLFYSLAEQAGEVA